MGRLHDDRGETLVELLITIMIIGVGLVAVVSMMGSTIVASDAHRGLAEGEVVLRDFGEAVKEKARANRDNPSTPLVDEYQECPDAATLTPAFTSPSGWDTPTITNVEYWIPTTFPSGEFRDGSDSPAGRDQCLVDYANCGDDLPSCDPGFVRVTYEVTDADNEIIGHVVVRRSSDGTP